MDTPRVFRCFDELGNQTVIVAVSFEDASQTYFEENRQEPARIDQESRANRAFLISKKTVDTHAN
jgi:hypothetical protein